MTNPAKHEPRLSADVIADAERILKDGNRVELMPTERNGVRVFEIVRREKRQKRRLTPQAQS